jgi:hypothetical protein
VTFFCRGCHRPLLGLASEKELKDEKFLSSMWCDRCWVEEMAKLARENECGQLSEHRWLPGF